jgi:hypothetical protein
VKVAALRRGFVRDGEGGAGWRAAHGGGVDFEMPIGDGGYPRGAIDLVVPTAEPISSNGCLAAHRAQLSVVSSAEACRVGLNRQSSADRRPLRRSAVVAGPGEE